MRDSFGLPGCTEDGQSRARPPPAVARTGRVPPRGYPGAGPGRARERFHPVTNPTVAAAGRGYPVPVVVKVLPRATTDLSRSEEHTSELQSLMRISYAGFFLNKTNTRCARRRSQEHTSLLHTLSLNTYVGYRSKTTNMNYL